MKKTVLMVAAALMSCMTSAWAQTPQTEATETATCGQTVTITATPDAGYKFLYWDDDHSLTSATRDVLIDDKTTIYDYVAVFGADTYTVIATAEVAEMGSVSGGGAYEFGTEVTLTATPSSKCYKFKQWSDGVETATRTITVAATTEANTYTAIFEEVEFTVKASTGGNGTVTIARK